MDDIDVFKCREGRLDYLGLLSFMAIAVPMTVILLNEFIGDAILDAVIPGIYAGILVMGLRYTRYLYWLCFSHSV